MARAVGRKWALALSLLLAAAGFLEAHAARGPAEQTLVIEHMYFDPRQQFMRASVEEADADGEYVRDGNGEVITPVTAKGKCKGAGCPVLDGVAVKLQGCAWSSLNDRVVYVEETAGWYLLWTNAKRTVPLVPTTTEVSRIVDGNEKGYLKQGRAGKLVF